MRLLALAAAVILGICCQGCPKPTPTPVTPTPVGDAASPATCLDLCRHGQALGCSWAQPTPSGATCVDVCANAQNSGITSWDLNCRTAAGTCAAVDRCR